MKQELTFGFGSIAIFGSVLLASCGSKPPAQTTTVNIEVPAAATNTKDSNESDRESGDTEIADLRESDDISGDVSGDKAIAKSKPVKSEPSEQEVEDSAPARRISTATPLSKKKAQLMDFYDRLESKHFIAFGGVNRRSLLKRKGAIVDYEHRFIEIPGSADPKDGDLRKLQITLFPRSKGGDEYWCAVSRIVWPQGNTPGKLDFYHGYSDTADRRPRTAGESLFPYEALGKFDGGWLSAYLPQRGLEIFTSSNTRSEANGEFFRYQKDDEFGAYRFVKVDMSKEER